MSLKNYLSTFHIGEFAVELNEHHLSILRDIFSRDPFPRLKTFSSIAQILHLPQYVIHDWFNIQHQQQQCGQDNSPSMQGRGK